MSKLSEIIFSNVAEITADELNELEPQCLPKKDFEAFVSQASTLAMR